MISTSCDITQFFSSLKDMDYLDIMYSVEQETTDAERLSYRRKANGEADDEDSSQYASLLKSFLFFMRYDVKPAGLNELDYQLFRSVKDLIQRKQTQVRCQLTH